MAVVVPSASPGIVPCVPVLGNNRLFIDFCLVMVVELNILCLSLVKGYSQWRKASPALVHTLYRDSVIYFTVLFLISITNLIFVVKTFNTPYFYIVAEPQRVLHAILASRVILHLRKVLPVDKVAILTISTGKHSFDRHAGSWDRPNGTSV